MFDIILFNPDGFVKSPTSALRCILRFFKVRKVRIITQDLRALNLNFFFAIEILLFMSLSILLLKKPRTIGKS